MQNVTNNRQYLAAVSGGPDSMAMLDIFKKNIKIVCHVNYHKRDSAKRDETIVMQFCKHYNIIFEKLDATKKLLAQYDSNNFQTCARMLRYDFFNKIAKKYKINHLFVAHNKDDFVETAMMQKARRSMTLFFGILPSQTWKDLIIERPLLSKRKKDLLTYCDRKHIPYGIDETNFDDHYTRNALRKEITKWTDKKFNAKFLEFKKHNVAHTKLRNTIDRAYHKWREGRWDVKLFQRRNHQLQIYILYRFLVDNNIHKISSAKIKLIQQFLLCANKRGTLRMGRQQILMKDKGYICLKKKLV